MEAPMDGTEFYRRVDKHPDLEWRGVREVPGSNDCEVIVLYVGPGDVVDPCMILRLHSILECSWEDLVGVLTFQRPARLMIHLTRIVGYFSRVNNWNRSKLAELRERHEGDYAVTPEGVERWGRSNAIS
jgi:hypothetical protein